MASAVAQAYGGWRRSPAGSRGRSGLKGQSSLMKLIVFEHLA